MIAGSISSRSEPVAPPGWLDSNSSGLVSYRVSDLAPHFIETGLRGKYTYPRGRRQVEEFFRPRSPRGI